MFYNILFFLDRGILIPYERWINSSSVLHFTCTLLMNTSNLQAARETGALKEAKDKLEKQVEDLTLRLQLEKRRRVHILLAYSFLMGEYRIMHAFLYVDMSTNEQNHIRCNIQNDTY